MCKGRLKHFTVESVEEIGYYTNCVGNGVRGSESVDEGL